MIANPLLFQKSKKGFTLLELLIVITILAILAVIIIFVLNPAETLKKSRDVQRMSDLATVKNALSLYLADVSSTDLDAGVASFCLTGTNTAAVIGYSKAATDAACIANVAEGVDAGTGTTFGGTGIGGDSCRYVASPNAANDGTGWIPVNILGITGGAPISNYPVDPINTVATNTAPTSADLVYRYACQQGTVSGTNKPSPAFELDAVLESTSYAGKMTDDGGDNTVYYEVGTSVRLIGDGTNF